VDLGLVIHCHDDRPAVRSVQSRPATASADQRAFCAKAPEALREAACTGVWLSSARKSEA